MGMENQTEILWRDKKRNWGMPISLVSYAVSEDRLLITEGFLSWKQVQVLLWSVQDIYIKRTFGQRLLGVGSVFVKTYDEKTYVLEDIRDPMLVKELIYHRSEEQKRLRRPRGSNTPPFYEWWANTLFDKGYYSSPGLTYR